MAKVHILREVENDVYVYGVLSTRWDYKLPFAILKTKEKDNAVERVIDYKNRYDSYPNDWFLSQIVENNSDEFFEIEVNPKQAYLTFAEMYLKRMRVKYGYAKQSLIRPLMSYDLMSEAYFPLAKDVFFERELIETIDEPTEEMKQALSEKFIELELKITQRLFEVDGMTYSEPKYRNQLDVEKRYKKFLKAKRKEMLAPKLIDSNTSVVEKKLIWKGKQKQLVELLVELQKKGWIENIGQGEKKKAIEALLSVIEIEGDFKGDVVNSTYQVFKGEPNKTTGEYEHDFGVRYKPNFSNIKENKKK